MTANTVLSDINEIHTGFVLAGKKWEKLGADAKGLSSLHQQGQVLAPDPALFIEDIKQNDETN